MHHHSTEHWVRSTEECGLEKAQRVPLLDPFLATAQLGTRPSGPIATRDPGYELGRMLADSHQDLLPADGIEGIAEVEGQHYVDLRCLEGVVG